MGTRFRKSVSLGKGVRLNVGKGSIGVSAGTKGAHISVNSKRGVTSTVGAPGTGLSCSKTHGWGASGGSKPAAPRKRPLVDRPLMPVMVICALSICLWIGVSIGGRQDSPAPPAASTSSAVSAEPTITNGATTTDVSVAPVPQSAPIDIIANGVVSYIESQGYAVASTRKIADYSRVECVITIPGVSDTDGSVRPGNWADIQSEMVALAAGAKSAVTGQGNYTVLTYVQSAGGDNLLAANAEKVIYDKFKLAEEAGTAQQTGQMVYVSASGSKYHSRPDCGNMSGAKQIPLSEAVARGLTPCSRCY